ncbi:hypothetical protein [Sphingorhabdus sp.]|uniref:hypothetical protein n=1 Tax=Sphingorhabdus sp. TaxID=1902408 RepID=UPI002FDADBF1
MNDDLTLDELLAELVSREEAISSFAKYVEYVSGLTPPPHLKLVCDKLDAVARGEIRRLMISMPPGHGKSFANDSVSS